MKYNTQIKKMTERSIQNSLHTQLCTCSGSCGAKCACKKGRCRSLRKGIHNQILDAQQAGEQFTRKQPS